MARPPAYCVVSLVRVYVLVLNYWYAFTFLPSWRGPGLLYCISGTLLFDCIALLVRVRSIVFKYCWTA